MTDSNPQANSQRPTMSFQQYLVNRGNTCKRPDRAAIRAFRKDTHGAKTIAAACQISHPGRQAEYDRKLSVAAEGYRKALQETGMTGAQPQPHTIPAQEPQRRAFGR